MPAHAQIPTDREYAKVSMSRNAFSLYPKLVSELLTAGARVDHFKQRTTNAEEPAVSITCRRGRDNELSKCIARRFVEVAHVHMFVDWLVITRRCRVLITSSC